MNPPFKKLFKIVLKGSALFVISALLFQRCTEEETPVRSYAVNLKAEGKNLNTVGLRSRQLSFDVDPVPTIHWETDNQLWGNDTLRLFASQPADSSHPVIVTISVSFNQEPTMVFSDTGVSEAEIIVPLAR